MSNRPKACQRLANNMKIEAVMNLEDYIRDLDPELQEKARACATA